MPLHHQYNHPLLYLPYLSRLIKKGRIFYDQSLVKFEQKKSLATRTISMSNIRSKQGITNGITANPSIATDTLGYQVY